MNIQKLLTHTVHKVRIFCTEEEAVTAEAELFKLGLSTDSFDLDGHGVIVHEITNAQLEVLKVVLQI